MLQKRNATKLVKCNTAEISNSVSQIKPLPSFWCWPDISQPSSETVQNILSLKIYINIK